MERPQPSNLDVVERILEAIRKKLEAHRDTVKKSPNYGRISWRIKNDTVDVDFDLRL